MTAHAPADPGSTAALAAQGLRYGLVDTADEQAFGAWIDADLRGFHRPRPTPALRRAFLDGLPGNRTTGVWDDTAAEPDTPVATVSSWASELTVSPGRTLPAWAVSSVTVAPTHRRRGIARAMLEGELRAAASAGFPVAILTVTEATIYGRYGFAPAAQAATITVDRQLARWIGPVEPGRVHFATPTAFREGLAELTDAAVRRTPGEAARSDFDHDGVVGLHDPEGEYARAVRIARYDDEHGEPRGFVAYRVVRTPPERGVVEVDRFVALDDAAERALWRFLVEQDFVDRIVVPLRPVDDPLPWLLENPRAVSFASHVDHLWLRVLDPVRALESRDYGAPGRLVLEIADAAGFAAGAFLLEADGRGAARAERLADPASAGARLRLGAQELASILLGGVRPSVLAAAGRIVPVAENGPAAGAGAAAGSAGAASGILELADRVFAPARTPLLSYWF